MSEDWDRLARLGGLRSVVDPCDIPGYKNRTIDIIHWRSLNGALPKSGRVLDLGCGTGRFAERIRRLGLKYVGVDSAHQMLVAAQAEHAVSGGAFVRSTAAALPFPDGSFDVCITCWAFQYISNTPAAEPTLREIWRVLAPAGRLLMLEQATMTNQSSGTVSRPSSESDYVQQIANYFALDKITTVRLGSMTRVTNALLSGKRGSWSDAAGLWPLLASLELIRARYARAQRLRGLRYYDILLVAVARSGPEPGILEPAALDGTIKTSPRSTDRALERASGSALVNRF